MIDKLNLNEDYIGGLSSSIDWVAGGNFDGYVYKSILKFSEGKVVKMKTIILEQSRYDGKKENSELTGRYEETDHKTLTCTFGETKMRGKILGAAGEYIAFSVSHPKIKYPISGCYKLREK